MLDSTPWILAQDAPPPPTSDGAPQAPANGQAVEGQDGSAQNQGQPPAQQQPQGSMWSLLLPLLLIAVLFLVMMGPQRKEKKRRQEMLSKLSKGDRIQTVGGILGTVVEVREEEVVVKVDENTNARLRFAKSAIQNVQQQDNA